MLQQGDVILEQVPKVPENAAKIKGNVLAKGEATGHAHVIQGQVQLYSMDEILYALVGDNATLVHEEHGMQVVSPGAYEVRKVREWDYLQEESRAVVD